MFVLDPARPLDAETYTIKGMLRKKSIDLIIIVNFYDFANIFFFFSQQFYTLFTSEGKLKKNVSEHFRVFYRENSVSSTHKEREREKRKRIKAKWKIRGIKLRQGKKRLRLCACTNVRAYICARAFNWSPSTTYFFGL